MAYCTKVIIASLSFAETLVRCREHKWDLEKLQLSRNEVEKRWIELGIKMVGWQIKGLEVELQIFKEKKELAQAQERTKALEVEAKKIEFEQRKHIFWRPIYVAILSRITDPRRNNIFVG